MKPLLQSEAAECGLACLAMICSAHGQHQDLPELRRRFAVSLKGANLRQLIGHAASLGFSSRPLRLELAELGQLQTPCILHWDLNHFVVLKKLVRGGRVAVILDPAVGERRLNLDEVSRHFTGVALELSPNADFKRQAPAPRVSLTELNGKVQGLKRSLLQIFAVAVVLELFAIVAPLFNQMVVDDVLTSGDRDLLTVLVLGFGLLLIVQTALGLARSWMVIVLGQTVALQWMGNVFAHLVRLPVAFFEKRHLGDITSRFGAVGGHPAHADHGRGGGGAGWSDCRGRPGDDAYLRTVAGRGGAGGGVLWLAALGGLCPAARCGGRTPRDGRDLRRAYS